MTAIARRGTRKKKKTPTNRKAVSATIQRFVPGQEVWTETTSGEPIKCTVIKYNADEAWYLLDSPEHGYAIIRDPWEVVPQP